MKHSNKRIKQVLNLGLIGLLILVFSCNKKVADSRDGNQIRLIKIGYYPTFHVPAETILNFDEDYLLFYTPSTYIVAPPPPPSEREGSTTEEKESYQEYLESVPKLNPFKASLTSADKTRLQDLVNTFTKEDFNDKRDFFDFDGMSVNIVLLFSNGKLVQMNPGNRPNRKQSQLTHGVLRLLMEKNTDKSDSIILEKIKRY